MERFSEDMLVRDVLTAHPEATAVLERLGLGCGSCLAADMDTLRSVASMHDIDLGDLLARLNALLDEEAS